jgi:hypothetical protein
MSSSMVCKRIVMPCSGTRCKQAAAPLIARRVAPRLEALVTPPVSYALSHPRISELTRIKSRGPRRNRKIRRRPQGILRSSRESTKGAEGKRQKDGWQENPTRINTGEDNSADPLLPLPFPFCCRFVAGLTSVSSRVCRAVAGVAGPGGGEGVSRHAILLRLNPRTSDRRSSPSPRRTGRGSKGEGCDSDPLTPPDVN